jgi:hypothetical protein
MAHLPVANQINHYVFLELLSVLCGGLENASDVFHAIGINMEDRRINSFGNISSINS